MFFFGLLSTPLPYLLVAVFYFIGFATGMFKGNVDSEPISSSQEKSIVIEPKTQGFELSDDTFHFHQYNFQKKADNCAVLSVQASPVGQKEKLIYFVHEIKIPHSSTTPYNFCRPPPVHS